MIKRLCRTLIPHSKRDERRAEVTIRGHLVTLWELRSPSTPPNEWRRSRIAQLRHDPTSGAWSLYWPDGKDKWHPWTGPNGREASLHDILQIVERDPLGIFFGSA